MILALVFAPPFMYLKMDFLLTNLTKEIKIFKQKRNNA